MSRARWRGVRSDTTRIAPSERRAASWSSHAVVPSLSPCTADRTMLTPAPRSVSSAPRMISIDHRLSSSLRTRSTIPPLRLPPRRW
ncbi:hypothetical protein GA0115246_109952 [Streptomyces sp. SolWspMP-sol7th]|nr:hypothetical protein GA0115246_109952 [Streptomyces sp. SolWspMP-sol7th]